MTRPEISIIMPAYNAAGFLDRSVGSVLAQTMKDWELIIIDDGSHDRTVKIARAYADKKPRIRVMAMKKNGGPSVARNKGIEAARGKWIAILDADDAMQPDRLARLYSAAVSHDLDMVADNQLLYDGAAKQISRALFPLNGAELVPWTLETLVLGDLPASGSYMGWMKPLIRKDVLRITLRYRPEYRYGEDFLLYAELLACGAKAAIVRAPGYIYTTRIGEISGAGSADTRTTASAEQLVTASLWFERTYCAQLTDHQLRLFQFRRAQNGLVPEFNHFKRHLKNNPLAALLTLLRHPGLGWFLWRTSKRLPTRLRLKFALGPRHG